MNKKKILVTGSEGMLGKDIINIFSQYSEIETIGVDLKDFDITSKDKTYSQILKINPDYIIHTAAYTNVDMAEKEQDICFNINVKGTENIVNAVKKCNSILCYISTDFIFNGLKKEPYIETDEPCPINIYGLSKLNGEKFIIENLTKFFIVRIAWLYGPNGKNFVSTIKKLCEEKTEISVVSDQIGCPTYTKDVSSNLLELLKTEKYGIYNMTGNGFCSWYEFAKKIIELSKYNTKILPITSDKLNRLAKRPLNSVLNNIKINKLLNRQVMPYWEESLRRYLCEF